MQFQKKTIISVVCIILSLILMSCNCLVLTGTTKKELEKKDNATAIKFVFTGLISGITQAEDELDALDVDSGEMVTIVKEAYNIVKNEAVSYNDANKLVKDLVNNKESFYNLDDLLGISEEVISLIEDLGDDAEDDDDFFDYYFDEEDDDEDESATVLDTMYSYLAIERIIAVLLVISAIVALIACVIWNNKKLGIPYMVMQLIVFAGVAAASIVLNGKDVTVRIGLAAFIIPVLAVAAFFFMSNERLFAAFSAEKRNPIEAIKGVNIDAVKNAVKKTAKNTAKSAEKLGAGAAAGIASFKVYKWECPECGFKNPDENKFCGNCGSKRPELSDDAKRMIAGLELQISTLTAENEKIKASNEEAIRKAVSTYEEENKTLTIKRDALVYEVTRLKDELKAAEEKLAGVSDLDRSGEIASLQSKLNLAEAEKQKAAAEAAGLKAENDRLKAAADAASSSGVSAEAMTKLQLENSNLTAEAMELKAKISTLESEHKASKTSKATENAALKKENASLKDEAESLQKENTSLKDETTSLKNENSALKTELEAAKEKLAKVGPQRKFCKYCGKTLE